MSAWQSAQSQAHPKIVGMVQHWQAMAPAPGLLPGRQHFDPASVSRLLPHLSLIDVLRGPPHRYRFRLIGTALVEAGVLTKRGDFLGEGATSSIADEILAIFNRIADHREIDWHRGKPLVDHSKHVAELERVFLPLATDGRTVDMIIGCTLFYWRDGHIY